ncbi:unnamed protein product [Schistosoma guineensis]|nr:unnamed protein product [Schistosoma guineensis]
MRASHDICICRILPFYSNFYLSCLILFKIKKWIKSCETFKPVILIDWSLSVTVNSFCHNIGRKQNKYQNNSEDSRLLPAATSLQVNNN